MAVLVSGAVTARADEDRLELKWGLWILVFGAVGFAGTFLRTWEPVMPWVVLVQCAVATLSGLRRCDVTSGKMETQLRLYFAFAFGFVAAQAAYPDTKWTWDLPFITVVIALLVTLPILPSRLQKARMARALPLSDADRAEWLLVGAGYWWAYWLFGGVVIGLALYAARARGMACGVSVLLASGAVLLPLKRLARRHTAAMREGALPLYP